jgi:hypothetical protein
VKLRARAAEGLYGRVAERLVREDHDRNHSTGTMTIKKRIISLDEWVALHVHDRQPTDKDLCR